MTARARHTSHALLILLPLLISIRTPSAMTLPRRILPFLLVRTARLHKMPKALPKRRDRLVFLRHAQYALDLAVEFVGGGEEVFEALFDQWVSGLDLKLKLRTDVILAVRRSRSRSKKELEGSVGSDWAILRVCQVMGGDKT